MNDDVAADHDSPAQEASFSGRVKRYVRVGSAVGTVAARYAGGRLLGRAASQGEQAAELKAALGGLKGPLMKVAQILATVPDMLPEDYTAELGQLQTNAPAMGWSFVKRRMTAELGAHWQKKFASFEHAAAAAASLGQVHRARGHDGRKLACKLQYPDMASAVEADLQQLKLIFAIYRRYDSAINPSELHAELSERLREELDYRREARHMALYGRMLAGEASVHVPEPIDALSTQRLLTMTWLDGEPILRFVDRHQKMRNRVAQNMFRAWYVPLYGYGVLHGDPHLGNYTVRSDGSINLFDFGCVRVFKAEFIEAIIDLYHALLENNEELAVHAYRVWGFRDLNRVTIEILNHWARFLYRPLMEDRVQTIQESASVAYGAQVAGRVHSELRRAGGVTPPRAFLLMDRAAIGLGSVFTRLHAEVNWHRLFHALIEDFDVEVLRRHQKELLEEFALPPPK